MPRNAQLCWLLVASGVGWVLELHRACHDEREQRDDATANAALRAITSVVVMTPSSAPTLGGQSALPENRPSVPAPHTDPRYCSRVDPAASAVSLIAPSDTRARRRLWRLAEERDRTDEASGLDCHQPGAAVRGLPAWG